MLTFISHLPHAGHTAQRCTRMAPCIPMKIFYIGVILLRLPKCTVVKNSPASTGDSGDTGWIPGSGRSPGEGNGYPLQYSCLENSIDRGAWQAIGHAVAKESDTTEHTHTQVLPFHRQEGGGSHIIACKWQSLHFHLEH